MTEQEGYDDEQDYAENDKGRVASGDLRSFHDAISILRVIVTIFEALFEYNRRVSVDASMQCHAQFMLAMILKNILLGIFLRK